MSKINVKAAMPPEACAKYLSDAAGEEITAHDVLHLVAQGHLTPSWYVRDLHVQMVFPACRLWGGWIHHEPATGLPRWPLGGVEDYERGVRDVINELVRIDTAMNPIACKWAEAAAVGDEYAKVSGDGLIIKDAAGNLWQAMTDLGEGYSTIPLNKPLPISGLVIQHADADAFVRLFGRTGKNDSEQITSDATRTAKQDDMAIELDLLFREIRAAGELIKAATVMPKLEARAGQARSCITDKCDGGGVLWRRGSSGQMEKMEMPALTERIRRWEKANPSR